MGIVTFGADGKPRHLSTSGRGHHPSLAPTPDAINLCIPCGIGDASWIWSKVKHLPAATGYPVVFSMPDAQPQRGHQLFDYLPEATWAGYETGWRNADVFKRTLPPTATYPDFTPGIWQALEVNTWLEKGRSLADWLPDLPVDYHYPLYFPDDEKHEAAALLAGLPRPIYAFYTSNRDKENYPGWALWSVADWTHVICALLAEGGSALFIGADYDRDKTLAVEALVREAGVPTRKCLGKRLGTALAALSACAGCVSYPSGIGILAGVLGVRTAMLLPDCKHHHQLNGFIDPIDRSFGLYEVFVNPPVEEVIEWFQ